MSFSGRSRHISLGGSTNVRSREQLLEEARQDRQRQQQRRRQAEAASMIARAFRSHLRRQRWKHQLRQEWDRDLLRAGKSAWSDDALLASLTMRLLLLFERWLPSLLTHKNCSKQQQQQQQQHAQHDIPEEYWTRLIHLSKLLFVNAVKKTTTDDPGFMSRVKTASTDSTAHLESIEQSRDRNVGHAEHIHSVHLARLITLWCSYLKNNLESKDALLILKLLALCVDKSKFDTDETFQLVCSRVSETLFQCLAAVVKDVLSQAQPSAISNQMMTLASSVLKRLITLDIPPHNKHSVAIGSAFVSSFLLSDGCAIVTLLSNSQEEQQCKTIHGALENVHSFVKILLGSKHIMTVKATLDDTLQLPNLLTNIVQLAKIHLQTDITQWGQHFEDYLELLCTIMRKLQTSQHPQTVRDQMSDDEENDISSEESEGHVASNAVEKLLADRAHVHLLFRAALTLQKKQQAESPRVSHQPSAGFAFGSSSFGIGTLGSPSSVPAAADNSRIVIAFAKCYHKLLATTATANTYLRSQLLSTLTFGLGLKSDGFLALLFDTIFSCRQDTVTLDVDLDLMDIFSQCYAHVLTVLDDDEFHKKQIPFTQDQNTRIAIVTKELCFDLYWRTAGHNQQSTSDSGTLLTLETRRLNLTKLLQQLHSRDSRRRFTPQQFDDAEGQNTFWWVKEATNLDYSSLRVEEWSNDTSEQSVPSSPLQMDDYEIVSRFSLGQRRMISLQQIMREPAPSSSSFSSKRTSATQQQQQSLKLILKNIPFVVPFAIRVKIFHDFIRQDKERLQQMHYPFTPPIVIRRTHVFEDAFLRLSHMSGTEMKKHINVQFRSEAGYEEAGVGAGVFKEFMTELCRQAFSPNYGLFLSTASSSNNGGSSSAEGSGDISVYPNPHSQLVNSDHLAMFEFLGKLLGKALHERLVIDVPFSRFFLAKLLDKKNFFNDLPSLDYELYRHLVFLKNYDGDVENDLALNFTIVDNLFGQTVVRPLIKDGQNVAVTNDNRLSYILRVANYRLNTQIRQQSDAFLRGLKQIIPQQWLRMFDENELFLLICGREDDIDVADWQRHTAYAGGYSESHPTIRLFWDVVRNEFSQQQRRLLLKFITSSRRPPLLGFKELHPPITIQMTREDQNRLPSASTCINLLKLAPITSRRDLKAKLIMAIEETEGFELS